ncbi:hypothetical protein ACFX13_007472 [Malus domestica]
MNLWLMENTGTSPLLRSRRLGSFLSTSSGPGVRGTPKIPVKKVGQTLRHDVCVGEDGWGSTLISCGRMATCFITVMVLTVIWAVIMVVLIPWPYERIKQGNVYGHVTGRLMGTRSRDGRLLPFKKGFVHLALQTGLPIVPMVLTGTHQAWRKGSLHVRPASLSVKYPPPIKTDGWKADKIDEHIKMVHDLYVQYTFHSHRSLLC